MKIQQANNKDVAHIANLAVLLWPEQSLAEMLSEVSETIEDSNTIYFLAVDKAQAVGFATATLRVDYVEGTHTSPVGYLEGIFILEQYRNKEIGTQLLKAFEHWAQQRGCIEFASDCALNNVESLAFHLSYGFEEVNRIICFKKTLG